MFWISYRYDGSGLMDDLERLDVADDFEYLLSFLPAGWEGKCKELGALRRCRKVPNAQVLLRVLLLHLAEGCSLRETAVRAKQGGLVELSDVAIMDRLALAGEWFRWMNCELLSQWVALRPADVLSDKWRVRVADGTLVEEPGPTGSCWRIHYAIDLPSLRCSELLLTASAGGGNGESFSHFSVAPNDLFIGDRGYGRSSDIQHVMANGGAVITRFAYHNLSLWTDAERRFDLLSHLRCLKGRATGDWPAAVKHKGTLILGRVCAVRRSRQSAEQAQRQAKKKARKNRAQIQPETLEAAEYIFVFTTLTSQQLRATRVLEFYRGRWQVELVFKRLKSIVGLGHLRKHDPAAARAWLQGKLLVAILVEVSLRYAEGFFPWGYPIPQEA